MRRDCQNAEQRARRDLLHDGPTRGLVQIGGQQVVAAQLFHQAELVRAVQLGHARHVHELLAQHLFVPVRDDAPLLVVDIDLAALAQRRGVQVLQHLLVDHHQQHAGAARAVHQPPGRELINAAAVGAVAERAGKAHAAVAGLPQALDQAPVPQLVLQFRRGQPPGQRAVHKAVAAQHHQVVPQADGPEHAVVLCLLAVQIGVGLPGLALAQRRGHIALGVQLVAVQVHQGGGAGLHCVGPLADLPQHVQPRCADLLDHQLPRCQHQAHAHHDEAGRQHGEVSQEHLGAQPFQLPHRPAPQLPHALTPFPPPPPGVISARRAYNWGSL